MSIFSNFSNKYLCKYTILSKPLDLYWFVYYYVYMFKYLLRRYALLSLIIYCKSHKRRPIHIGTLPCLRDVQADIPVGWCQVCGCEVFEENQDRCIRCRTRKGDNRK